MYDFLLIFHWNLFLVVQLTIFQHRRMRNPQFYVSGKRPMVFQFPLSRNTVFCCHQLMSYLLLSRKAVFRFLLSCNTFSVACFPTSLGIDPFYQNGLTLVPTWTSNYIPSKVWDEIIHPFPNLNGSRFEVWKWISNFIPHSTMHVITHPCRDA